MIRKNAMILKNQIEVLIYQGKLKKFVGRNDQHYKSRRDEGRSWLQTKSGSHPEAQDKEKQQVIA